MEKYINEHGKPYYSGVNLNDIFSEFEFYFVPYQFESDIQYALHTNLGSLTVLDRMTGFGFRDTETGFRSPDGEFWLASGMLDVRLSGSETIGEAIDWIKKNANTCTGKEQNK